MSGSCSGIDADDLDKQKVDILKWIATHDICFVEAATGMGKSSRIPQYVIDEDPDHIVWQLQPRRLAAKRLAEYCDKMRASSGEVGYRVRGESCTEENARLIFMTTGYFLHWALHHLQHMLTPGSSAPRERWYRCTHLFVDEVHEASAEIELVLLTVKLLASAGKLPFKVVILSATLDFDTLFEYFIGPQDSKDGNSEEGGDASSRSPLPPRTPPPLIEGESASQVERSMKSNRHVPEVIDFMLDASTHGSHVGIYFHESIQKKGAGPRIKSVQGGSLAAAKGLQPEDELFEVNGRRVMVRCSQNVQQEVQIAMQRRPLRLRFLRSKGPEPPIIATTSKVLAQQTRFPVEMHYFDDLPRLLKLANPDECRFNQKRMRQGQLPDPPILDMCATCLLKRHCASPADCALVFLPGMAEIEYFNKVLDKKMDEVGVRVDVAVLHSAVLSENCGVPPASDVRATVYLATSIAETSITLPDVTVVFDFGLSRTMVYDSRLEMDEMRTQIASKSAVAQRAGRVGRTQPGEVYRVYPQALWQGMPTSDALGGSSQRCLEGTTLLVAKTIVKCLNIHLFTCMANLIRPPSQEDIQAALERLEELDAISLQQHQSVKLTAFGDFTVRVSVLGPRLARLVYCGLVFEMVRPAIVLAAVHTVCGRQELWNIPYDMFRKQKEEEAAVKEDAPERDLAAGTRPSEDPDREEDDLRDATSWTANGLMQLTRIARFSMDLDGGWLSEPAMVLRIVDMFFSQRLPKGRGDDNPCALNKLRHIDALSREIASKLRAMYNEACFQSASQKHVSPEPGAGSAQRENIFLTLTRDETFQCTNFSEPLAGGATASSSSSERRMHFLSGLLCTQHEPEEEISRIRLMLCAAFPTNFLFSTLTDDEDEVEEETSGQGMCLRAELRRPCRDSNPVRAAVAQEVQAGIYDTFQVSVNVEQPQGSLPGLLVIAHHTFQEEYALDGHTRLIGRFGLHNAIDMVAQKDSKRRLHLLDRGSVNPVKTHGEWRLRPSIMWHLLRSPGCFVKPAARLTPTLRTAALPSRTTKAKLGFRIAVAMGLEASLRPGVSTRIAGSKAKLIRPWLMSWLPNKDSDDLAMLLTFWPRGLACVEDLDWTAEAARQGQPSSPAYASMSINNLVINFPQQAPLLADSVLPLSRMHMELRKAFREGDVSREALPTLAALGSWGQQYLRGARVDTGPDGAVIADSSGTTKYFHHRGFGAVQWTVVEPTGPDEGLLPGRPLRPLVEPSSVRAGPSSEKPRDERDVASFSRAPLTQLHPKASPWIQAWHNIQPPRG